MLHFSYNSGLKFTRNAGVVLEKCTIPPDPSIIVHILDANFIHVVGQFENIFPGNIVVLWSSWFQGLGDILHLSIPSFMASKTRCTGVEYISLSMSTIILELMLIGHSLSIKKQNRFFC